MEETVGQESVAAIVAGGLGKAVSLLSSAKRTRLVQVAGIIFDIQRYSLHDGPGLRTDVFFKGCPLRCGWCANPESQHLAPEIALFAHNCIDCGLFETPCSVHVRKPNGRMSPGATADYDARIAVCPTGAIAWMGTRRTAGEIMREVLRDLPFYDDGGGLTLTGGEPTMQPELADALLRLAKDQRISTTLETCGHTQWPVFERLLPHLDHILYDVKHLDPVTHRAYTGVDNKLILDNLQRLAAVGAPVIVRIPLIPGFNADPVSITSIADFVKEFARNVGRVDLLPYHTLAKAKHKALGRKYAWEGHERLAAPEVEKLAAIVQSFGFDVSVGGA